MQAFLSALLLQGGFNTALVAVGSAILGASAAAIGAFVLLRKRSLVSDAVSHATLPGLVLAFIVMAAVTGDGRNLPALLIGAAVSAAFGLFLVDWTIRRTRLTEDTAIGAVLSVFFGFGIVLLTIVQSLQSGGQAGLESFLLGSTASMLQSEAQMIAIAAAIVGAAVFLLRQPFTLLCFDPAYAATRGLNVRLLDTAMMALMLLVTVIGLRVAGLVLIVALTIIPPVAARFWTDRPGRMVALSAVIGALAAYIGAIVSSLDAALPTGALIVLASFALFVVSLLVSPKRGLLAGGWQRRSLKRDIRLRQGLLRLAAGRSISDPATRRALRGAGAIDGSGNATPVGRLDAAAAAQAEARFSQDRRADPEWAARTALQIAPLTQTAGEGRA